MDPFVETILMSSAFRAATGQGKGTHVYRSVGSGEDKRLYDASRKQFRSAFRDVIKSTCRNYDARITKEDDWMSLIQSVRESLTADHQAILEAQNLRFGIVQKMLSLSLKLYWKSGEVTKRPFWPPLDGQVIRAARPGLAKEDRTISWKKLDDPEQYRRMMQAIDEFARSRGHIDACEWEYNVWKTNDDL